MLSHINETHYADRLLALLSAAFGLVAMLLALIAPYGVRAFTVTRRTRELLGVRMAVGVTRTTVIAMVMTEVAVVGICAALPITIGLGGLYSSDYSK